MFNFFYLLTKYIDIEAIVEMKNIGINCLNSRIAYYSFEKYSIKIFRVIPAFNCLLFPQ